MAHLENLKDNIERHDPEKFLVDFLTMIKDGVSLTLPTTISKDAAQMQWRDAIPQNCGNPSDAFISDLATMWATIVQEHGGISSKSLPEELLDLILKKGITPNTTKQLPHDGHSIQRVTPSISSDYTKLEKARKQPLKSKAELIQICNNALHFDNETAFLAAYLELNVVIQKNALPKSSISGKAYQFWDGLTQEKFKQKMPDDFLEKLSGIWINAVAKKGLPTSDFQVAELYYHVKANYEQPKIKMTENPSKLKRFLRFLRSI